MAHPFRYFRKHQKAFLAVAAVIAMFVFVIGDAMFGYIGQGGGPDPNQVVASWKGGRVTLMELDSLTQRRHFISQFLNQLRMMGASRLIEEGGTPVMPQVPDFVLPEGSTPRDVQVGVVTTRILANEAKKAGITISDEIINHFLRETSFRRVTNSEIMQLLQAMRSGDVRNLEEQLFTGLRELLMGNAYFGSFNANIRNVLPEQRWEDWKRLNERISLEVATVRVADFVDEVADPSDAELRAFYEEHKDVVGHQTYLVLGAELPSADPGFKEPRRVKLNYILGDVNAWAEKYRDSITEEEIADYYERNKRTQFVKTGSSTSAFDESLFDSETETPVEEAAEPGDSADEAASTQEDSQLEAVSSSDEEVSESESVKQPSDLQADEAQSDADSAEETVEPTNTDSVEPPTDDETTPANDQSGAAVRTNTFRLAAFQNNADDDEATSDDESAMRKAVEEAVTEGDPTESSENGGAASDGAGITETGESEVEEEIEYDPIDAVRDSIRSTLAKDKAVIELKKVIDRIYGQLQSEYNPYGFEVIKAKSEKREVPAPPSTITNLKERAAEAGLISEETVSLTQRELADTFVGKAMDAQSRSEFVVQAAFDDLQLFEPMLAQDLDGNWYLVTKVEDIPERTPPFDEIKDAVKLAWKEREAAKLALKRSEDLAKEAEASGDSLGTFFISKPYEVLTTDMFSFLSFGTTPAETQRGPRLGDAPPLEAVGPDFMTKAFELKEGEVAAMLNYNQTNAYVFRLNQRELPPNELKSLFLREANDWFGGQVMTMARWQSQQRQLLEELTKRVGLDLERLEELLRDEHADES